MSFLAFLVSLIVLALKSSFKNLKLAAVIVHLLDWQFSILPSDNRKSTKDFINAFTGYSPKDKIIWKGHFGDLKTFINHSIKEKFLEKVSQKWIITSSIFLNDEIAFNEDKIRSTKETKSKENIKKLVDNCMI